MKNRSLTLLLLLLSPLVHSSNPPSDEPSVPLTTAKQTTVAPASELTIHPLKVIKRSQPKYPKKLIKNKGSGWVTLTFDVDTQGHPQNITVTDEGGASGFAKSAIAALKRWRYQPAQLNDAPIISSNVETTFNFALDRNQLALKPSMQRRLMHIQHAMQKEHYKDAKNLLDRFKRSHFATTGESIQYRLLLANYYRAVSQDANEHQILLDLSKATKNLNSNDIKTLVLERLFATSSNLKHYTQALDTWQALLDFSDNTTKTRLQDSYAPYVARINQRLASDKPIEHREAIGKQESWSLPLNRRQFQLSLDSFEQINTRLSCDHKSLELTLAPDDVISLQPNWGDCTLTVYGSPGNIVSLMELADNTQRVTAI